MDIVIRDLYTELREVYKVLSKSIAREGLLADKIRDLTKRIDALEKSKALPDK